VKTRRIIVNNDFYNIFQIEPPVTDQDVLDAVDKMAGTQVDTLALDVPDLLGEDTVVDPDLAELYRRPEGDECLENLRRFIGEGKDPFRMLLDRAHEKGLEFFASLRLNDTHYKDQPFNPMMPQFYYDNLHNRIGEPQGRLNCEFDYRKSVIREHYLATIRAAVEQYDVDGFELDFTRNCKFFPEPCPEECAPVLTQFVRDVRAILDEIGRGRGKELVLSAAVPYPLRSCRKEGLDIPAWARLGLINVLCLSTPFLAEFEHDVADTRLKVPGVQVYAGCDRNFAYGFDGASRVVPMQTYRAMAMSYLRQGADGIYLFNVMSWTMNYDKANVAVRRDGGQGETEGAAIDYDAGLMNELGDVATLDHLDKLYVLSGGEDSPDRTSRPLPVTVPAKGEVTLRLYVGDDVAKAAATGRIESIHLQTVSSDCADYGNYTVKLNTVDLSRQYAFVPFADKPEDVLMFPEPGRRGPLPEPQNVRRHPVRPIDLQTGINFIAVKSYRDPLTITGVELAIKYR
jgi:hypothetical protein